MSLLAISVGQSNDAFRHGPAKAGSVFELGAETRRIDQKLFRHAAADDAGAADAILFREHHARAMERGDARGAHATRATAYDEQIDVVIGHARNRAEALPLQFQVSGAR